MKVTINEIKHNIHNNQDYRILYFDYMGEKKFTYVSPKVLQYWQKRLKMFDFDFEIDMNINIFKVPNSNNYKIVGVTI